MWLTLESIAVAPWDFHPNAEGHRLLAEELYRALQEMPDELPLGLSAPAR